MLGAHTLWLTAVSSLSSRGPVLSSDLLVHCTHTCTPTHRDTHNSFFNILKMLIYLSFSSVLTDSPMLTIEMCATPARHNHAALLGHSLSPVPVPSQEKPFIAITSTCVDGVLFSSGGIYLFHWECRCHLCKAHRHNTDLSC